jgi:hypothetical protein
MILRVIATIAVFFLSTLGTIWAGKGCPIPQDTPFSLRSTPYSRSWC